METRASVTAEIQTVDENEKPLYSDKEKEKLIQLVKTLLSPEKVVSMHKLKNTKELLRFILMLKSSAGLDTKKMGSELSTELAKLEVS